MACSGDVAISVKTSFQISSSGAELKKKKRIGIQWDSQLKRSHLDFGLTSPESQLLEPYMTHDGHRGRLPALGREREGAG